MFTVKGVHLYYRIGLFMLLFQMLKLTNFVLSMEIASLISVILTMALTMKLVVFEKKLHEAKYLILIVFMMIQEVGIGLDKILSNATYSIVVMSVSLLSLCVIYGLDALSIRKQMDEDAYSIKNACSLLAITYSIAIADILLDYMFPSLNI